MEGLLRGWGSPLEPLEEGFPTSGERRAWRDGLSAR